MTEGQPVAREVLVDEICARSRGAWHDERAVLTALRRFKRRETLRIAYGDIVRGQPLDTVAAADFVPGRRDRRSGRSLRATHSKPKRGVPRSPTASAAAFVVLALGKLGGVELNYSSDIDLIFLYEADGADRRPAHAAESRVLRSAGARSRQAAHRADRPGRRLSRRSAAAARRQRGPDGAEPRQRAALLRRVGPHLGAAGVRQGPADRRRSGPGPASSSRSSSRGSIAAT